MRHGLLDALPIKIPYPCQRRLLSIQVFHVFVHFLVVVAFRRTNCCVEIPMPCVLR